jgi:hypothetical protein
MAREGHMTGDGSSIQPWGWWLATLVVTDP